MGHLHRPLDTEAFAQRGHRQLAEVVTGQLQGAFAANPGLGIVREGRKPVQLLKNAQEDLGGLDTLEAAEVLVVLVKTANDLFHRVVGLGNDLTLDGVDQFRPAQWVLTYGAPGNRR